MNTLLEISTVNSSNSDYLPNVPKTNLDLSEDDGGAVITRSLVVLADSTKLDGLEKLIQRTGVKAAVGPGQLAILDGEARVAALGTIKNVTPAADVD